MRSTLFFRFMSTLVLAILISSNALSDDWAHWRGPSQNGISLDKNLVTKWQIDDKEKVKWVSDIGGRATPIILNGRVYLNCRTKHNFNNPDEKIHLQQQVVCWDLKTGDEIWKKVFNVAQTDVDAPRVGWASMCGDAETGNVFVYTVDGILRCYNGANGDTIWECNLAENYGAMSGYGGRTQTPIIDEDQVIISTLAVNWGALKGPSPKHFYFSFDKKTGKLNWLSAPGAAPKDTNQSVPFVITVNGQRMLVGGNSNGTIYAMQARTGKPIWGFRMSKRGLNATATFNGDKVFISHGEDNIDNDKFGRVQCIDATGTGDVTATKGVWRHDALKAGFCGLLEKDGLLFVLSDTGNLYAFDSEKGDLLWEHNLGTVGKSAPVWADGHIYVTEVNGNIYTLKATKQGCETVNHVHLEAKNVEGADEIYASPAISDGHIVFVTRDRTICVAAADATPAERIKAAEEPAAEAEVDVVQLRPYEVVVGEGDKVEYEIHAFDKNGRFIKKTKADVKVGDGLSPLTANGNQITVGQAEKDFAGLVTAEMDGKTATARVRVMPSAGQWNWDFEGFKGIAVPPSWIRAHIKMKPLAVDGNTVMRMGPGKGRPSHTVWIGTPEMKNYEIQCDVMMKEQRRQLGSVGIANQKYTFIVDGNNGTIALQSWPGNLRMYKEKDFEADPDTWYTLKMIVDVADGKAMVRGKIWEKGSEEPAEWSIEAEDPHPNLTGSPGVYTYALADCYYDNLKVTPRK